jgi:hypothetical protein
MEIIIMINFDNNNSNSNNNAINKLIIVTALHVRAKVVKDEGLAALWAGF